MKSRKELDKEAERMRQKYVVFLSAGICPRCRKVPVLQGKTKCQACFDKKTSIDNSKKQ